MTIIKTFLLILSLLLTGGKVHAQTVSETPKVGSGNSLIIAAAPASLTSAYVTATAAGWLMVFNSITVPSNGSTTAGTASGNLVECIQVPAAGTYALPRSGVGVTYSVGITAVYSSAGCGTLTAAASQIIVATVGP